MFSRLHRATEETAQVYKSEVDDQSLTFRLLNVGEGTQVLLEDQETGLKYKAFSRQAVDGRLKGK